MTILIRTKENGTREILSLESEFDLLHSFPLLGHWHCEGVSRALGHVPEAAQLIPQPVLHPTPVRGVHRGRSSRLAESGYPGRLRH